MGELGRSQEFVEIADVGGYISAFVFGKKSSEKPLHKANSRHLWAADLPS
jgi:hypothetical protein